MDPDPITLSIRAGEFEIQYLDYEGKDPGIVFLHATGFLPWTWHPVARRLRGKFRMAAPYFCDHRQDGPEEGGVSWALLARDMSDFLRALGWKDVFLVGHSMGGTVITLAEALYGPLARKLILIEPIYLPESIYGHRLAVDEHPLASKSIRRRNHWRDATEAERYLRGKELFQNWDEESLDYYIRYGMKPGESEGLTLTCHPVREAALFLGSSARDPWPLLSKLTCPVLFIEGENSPNRSYIDLEKAASLVPQAERKIVPGAGHLIPMEKPGEIVKIIEEFFQN